MATGHLIFLGLGLVSVAACAFAFLAAGVSFLKRKGRRGGWFLASGLFVLGAWVVMGIAGLS